jgi:hypothetical protein
LTRIWRIDQRWKFPFIGVKRLCRHSVRNDVIVPQRSWCDPSIDHLVGAQQERFRDRQPERLDGRKIDDEIELSWLLAMLPD